MVAGSVGKAVSKGLASLFGFALIKQASYERLMRRQYLYRDMLYLPDGLLQHMRENKGQMLFYPFGCLELGDRERGNILWTTHDYGFFSCLTTTLWTITDMLEDGHMCDTIDNTYSMQAFKSKPNIQTWPELFMSAEPLKVASMKMARPRIFGHFDHHARDYNQLIRARIGSGYLDQLLSTYLCPSRDVLDRMMLFESKYQIAASPTITVCYRGTDKHTEIQPTPLAIYFQHVERQMKIHKEAAILIQTDQAQVREKFLDRYRGRCKYIEELPVSHGTMAIHNEPRLRLDGAEFAKNLVAMCLALSKSKVLITHTGNTGFFLAIYSLLNGTPIVQLR